MKERDFSPEARRRGNLRAARILAVVIFLGAGTASLLGLLDRTSSFGPGLPGPGASSFMSLWNEPVQLEGRGLYRRDSVSGAAQERAQDFVTLVFALPLLALAIMASGKGSLASRLLLGGALGYFLYCYGMMAVGTAYNELFLLYAGLLALCLPAFCFALFSVDLEALAEAATAGYPRKRAAALCLVIGLFLGLNWLGRIVLPSLAGGLPPQGLESYSTLFVQALDLGILVPAALVSAFWLFRRDPRGYLLGSVLIVKGAAEGLAVAAMGFNMLRAGVAESLPLILCFLALALAALGLGILVMVRLAPAGSGGAIKEQL